VLSLGKGLGADLPDVDPEGSYTGAEALDISHEVLGTLFPALRG
jgi:phospholipase C